MTQGIEATREKAANRADQWLEALEPELRNFPRGTVVVIDLASGSYVTAGSRLEGLEKFEQRFGVQAEGWLHEVGGGVFVGGGLAKGHGTN